MSLFAEVRIPWKPQRFITPEHGYAWGFWLPGTVTMKFQRFGPGRVLVGGTPPTATCCGFCDERAAFTAAGALQRRQAEIPEPPSAAYEAFALGESWAFLDLFGDVHAPFPARRDAQGYAARLEGEHMRAAHERRAASSSSSPSSP